MLTGSTSITALIFIGGKFLMCSFTMRGVWMVVSVFTNYGVSSVLSSSSYHLRIDGRTIYALHHVLRFRH
jgi:hypothetical protein